MARKIVTLYVDDTSLRLLVTRGRRIKKWAELSLEPGLIKSNVVIKEAEVAARIKQLFKAQKIRARRIIVGLSGLHCLTRPIILPQLPRTMLAEAVMREAKRVLPVPLEQLYISWQTIPAPEGKIQVFLMAIPCKTADALLKMLRQAGGLKPYLMDLKPLALARVVGEATAVIVDVQPTEFEIIIMADGVPQPIRTVPFPSEAPSQQEKWLKVREELDRTIKFYNSNNPEKPLPSRAPIFVSGELADEPELHSSLSDEFQHPVLPLSSPLMPPEPLNSTRYLVNIGLALKERSLGKEARPSVANLNALPIPYRPKPLSIVRIVGLPSAVSIVAVLVLLIISFQDASANISLIHNGLDNANRLLTQRQSKKTELVKSIAELDKKLAKVEASLNTFTAALSSLDRQGDMINRDLEVAANRLPSSVNLTSINHSDDKLTIQGRAPSEVEALDYARSLDSSGRFPEIIIASIKQVQGKGMDFILTLKTRGED